ncbi:MAG: ferrous iron transport protein A, partial [Bacteroidetes bacterium]|nr:ferrous iron transport protein A [Bacteroidota bacterium]
SKNTYQNASIILPDEQYPKDRITVINNILTELALKKEGVVKKDEIVEENMVRLSSLKENETARILGISKESRGDNRRRLLDLGFVKGTKISIDLISPMKNPIAYLVKGTSIALRKDQASKILIKKD